MLSRNLQTWLFYVKTIEGTYIEYAKKICIYPERTKVYKELLQYWEDNKENINSVIYTNNLKNIN